MTKRERKILDWVIDHLSTYKFHSVNRVSYAINALYSLELAANFKLKHAKERELTKAESILKKADELKEIHV
jgi:hypothetical protein